MLGWARNLPLGGMLQLGDRSAMSTAPARELALLVSRSREFKLTMRRRMGFVLELTFE
jgi:hypothetical protein